MARDPIQTAEQPPAGDAAEAAAPWREPAPSSYPDPETLRLTGLEQLRTFIHGESPRPPISHLTGMQLTDVGAGTAVFRMPITHWHLSPQGIVAVGALAVLADGPLGCAVQSSLPAGTAYTTSELSLSVLRPVAEGATLTAKGRLVQSRRTLALSEVSIEDQDGRLVAHGTSLCFVFPPRSPEPGPPAADGALRSPDPPPAEPPGGGPDPYLRPALGEVLPQETWDRMSGREVLDAQATGDLPLPPLHYLIGTNVIEIADRETVCTMPASEWLCSPLRTVQGGAIGLLADLSLTAAVMTTVPAGAAMAPVNLKVNYLRPCLPDGRELRATGRVTHAGRTIAVGNSEVVNADGKRVALATGSVLMLPGRPASLKGVDPD